MHNGARPHSAQSISPFGENVVALDCRKHMEAEMIGLPIGLISTRVASSCRDASRIQLSRATQ
jgi:hypothetical protein